MKRLLILSVVLSIPIAMATHTEANLLEPTDYTSGAGGCETYKSTTIGERYTVVFGNTGASSMQVKGQDAETPGNVFSVFTVSSAGGISFDSAVNSAEIPDMDVVLEYHNNDSGGWAARVSFTTVETPLAAPFDTASFEWDNTGIFCFGQAIKSFAPVDETALLGYQATYISTDDGTSEVGYLFAESETPEPPPPPVVPRSNISGPDGALYGGDKTAFAATLGITEGAVDGIYTVGFVMMGAAIGYGIHRSIMASSAGAVAGVFFAIGMGVIPAWVVAFFAILGVAAYVLFRRRQNA